MPLAVEHRSRSARAEGVHNQLVMKDSTQRRSERDYCVLSESAGSGAEVGRRDELERVREINRYDLEMTKAERGGKKRDEAGFEGWPGGLDDKVGDSVGAGGGKRACEAES
ncbi:hypothetical protein NBRC10512_007454 [Rhodotorula toruloides]